MDHVWFAQAEKSPKLSRRKITRRKRSRRPLLPLRSSTGYSSESEQESSSSKSTYSQQQSPSRPLFECVESGSSSTAPLTEKDEMNENGVLIVQALVHPADLQLLHAWRIKKSVKMSNQMACTLTLPSMEETLPAAVISGPDDARIAFNLPQGLLEIVTEESHETFPFGPQRNEMQRPFSRVEQWRISIGQEIMAQSIHHWHTHLVTETTLKDSTGLQNITLNLPRIFPEEKEQEPARVHIEEVGSAWKCEKTCDLVLEWIDGSQWRMEASGASVRILQPGKTDVEPIPIETISDPIRLQHASELAKTLQHIWGHL